MSFYHKINCFRDWKMREELGLGNMVDILIVQFVCPKNKFLAQHL